MRNSTQKLTIKEMNFLSLLLSFLFWLVMFLWLRLKVFVYSNSFAMFVSELYDTYFVTITYWYVQFLWFFGRFLLDAFFLFRIDMMRPLQLFYSFYLILPCHILFVHVLNQIHVVVIVGWCLSYFFFVYGFVVNFAVCFY